MDRIKQDVERKISEKKVVVYSKPGCPYCDTTKRLFKEYIKSGDLKAKDYEVVDLNKLPNGDQYQRYFLISTKARTVPRVFINGKCVGGGDDVCKLRKDKVLPAMLNSKN